MVAIGTCLLGAKPRVAVAIRDGVPRSDLDRALGVGADIIEVRVDQFSNRTAEHVRGELAKLSGIPRLGTIRMAAEGGAWTGSEAERLALYENLLPEVEALDIELHAEEINHSVIQLARQAGKTTIGSFHDFQRTPALEHLLDIVHRGRALGVDIVKIAAHCSSRNDLHTLARLLLTPLEQPLIVLGMGPEGTASRLLFPALGSLLTYTFLGTPTAPGQMTLEQTVHLLDVLYPNADS